MLALDAGIHAAIVGGLIGGAVVFGGAALTEWLRRIGGRRAALEAAVHELGVWLPIWLVYLGPDPPNEGSEIDSSWTAQQRVTDALFRAEASVRRGPLRNRAAISAALDDLSARTTAAMIRVRQGRRLSREEQMTITTAQVRALVIGDRKPLDEEVERYVREGFADAAIGPPVRGDQ